MRLLASQKEIATTFNALLAECESISFAVAWATCGFNACDQLLKLRRKIRRGVVGTHFYQTDPEFIKKFVGNRTVKFNTNTSGVFHPKVYLFEGPGKNWNCLIGSANFTRGAFGKNSELVVYLESGDDLTDTLASKVNNQIDIYWQQSTAKFAKEIDLEAYRYWRHRFKRPLEKLQGNFGSKKSKKTLDKIKVLQLEWPTFMSKVRRDRHHALSRRIKVLTAARALFEKYGSLAVMPESDRQGIGGYRESPDMPWGWFGSMKGAGTFRSLLTKQPKQLSDALDQIPLRGPVQRSDYEAFVSRYRASFPKKNGKPTRHGLATASRLLAMKRPDYFVCLDSANKAKLSHDFGIVVYNHDYDAYWDSIIERIVEARWWNSRRPKGEEERQVWDGRAAFLDAIYYVPVEN